jgi:spore coat protein CotH
MISLPNVKETVDYSQLTNENYKQFLNETTVEKIEYYLEENFYLDDMIIFIQEHGDNAFCEHYDDYVDAGETYSYDAVDAFIEEFGVYELGGFMDAYRGAWSSKAEYAENYVSDCYSVDFPDFIEIDWENTFDNLDCVYVNGFVFDTKF